MKYKILISCACLAILSADLASASSSDTRPQTAIRTSRLEGSDNSKNSQKRMSDQSRVTNPTTVRELVQNEFGTPSGELPAGVIPLDEALKSGKLGEYGPYISDISAGVGSLPSEGVYISAEQFLKASQQTRTSSRPSTAGRQNTVSSKEPLRYQAATAFLD